MRVLQLVLITLLTHQLACVSDGGPAALGFRGVPQHSLSPPPTLYATRAPRISARQPQNASTWYPTSKRLSRRWTCVVIHHSATPGGNAKLFDKFHRSKGWEGLGYHFVIGNGTDSPDGQVEVGARWQNQTHGAHCKTDNNYYNEHGIGICLVGDFTKKRPTARQMASLEQLVAFLVTKCHIPPNRITSHGAVTGKTQCPGTKFPLQAFKRRLKTSIARASGNSKSGRKRARGLEAAKYRMHSTAAPSGPMGRSSR